MMPHWYSHWSPLLNLTLLHLNSCAGGGGRGSVGEIIGYIYCSKESSVAVSESSSQSGSILFRLYCKKLWVWFIQALTPKKSYLFYSKILFQFLQIIFMMVWEFFFNHRFPKCLQQFKKNHGNLFWGRKIRFS